VSTAYQGPASALNVKHAVLHVAPAMRLMELATTVVMGKLARPSMMLADACSKAAMSPRSSSKEVSMKQMSRVRMSGRRARSRSDVVDSDVQ